MTNRISRTFTVALAMTSVLLDTSRAQLRIPLPVVPVAPPSAPAPPVATPATPVGPVPVGPIVLAPPPPPQPLFYLHSYLGKCLDFGSPANPDPSGQMVSQLAVRDCNNSPSQQIKVVEVDNQHDVVLYAGNEVLGISIPLTISTGGSAAAAWGSAPPIYGLELQQRNVLTAMTTFGQHNQVFALDGDSIVLASNRNLVVQVQNARGSSGSPVVVTQRNLADSEFWDFNQINGVDMDPTGGFVRVGFPGSLPTAKDILLSRIAPYGGAPCSYASSACVPSPALPGTVIEIYPGTDIDLTGVPSLEIPPGVTIRGSRRGTLLGALVHKDSAAAESVMLDIQGDNVRITGLRLQGFQQRNHRSQ